MTKEDFNKEVRVPIWVITACMVIAMALLGFMWKQATVQGQMIEQVRQLRIDVDTHIMISRSQYERQGDKIREKADKREIDQIHEALRRIENKLQ